MKKLTLHLGMHRCASTTMQSLLRANRAGLAERGVGIVLRREMEASKPLDMRAWHRLPVVDPRWWGARGRFIDAVEAMPFAHVIVSEENLIGTMPSLREHSFYPKLEVFLRRLNGLKSHFDLRVRFVVRRQDRFLNSVYAFRLARGLNEDFDSFLASFPKDAFDWNKFTNALDTLGLAENSRIAVMDGLQGPALNRQLADLIEIDPDGLRLKGRGNPSLPACGLPLLLAINRVGLMPERADRRARLLPLVSKMTHADFAALAPVFSAGDISKIESCFDENAAVTFGDAGRAAFLASYGPANAQFLNHPVVSASAQTWAQRPDR